MGPNGAGKSTLLKTLTAFLPPLKGEILIQNKELKSYSEADLAKVIGVVLTERLHINNMSVDELVGMGRSPYTGFWGHMSAYDKQVVDESIALVGIEGLRGRMMQRLSDGERQKVMIAKALAQETPVIFLDEPTAFLDYPSKVEIMQLLQRLSREKKKTVFLSTHDLDLALQLADCVWLLDGQGNLTTGLPEQLILDGTLPHFFQSDGVCFDSTTGHFSVNHHPTHPIPIRTSGQGLPLLMLRRALQRQGFALLDSSVPPHLEAPLLTATLDTDGAPCFVLNSNSSVAPLRFSTIETLLEALKTTTNATPSPTNHHVRP